MQKSIECTGKTEEAAIAAGLKQLGLAREEVSVEVLELAKSGFLGIGGNPAKVKVTYEVPDEPEAPAAPAAVAEAPKGEPADVPAPAPEKVGFAAAPCGEDPQAEKIAAFLSGLLERMEIQAEPQVTRNDEGDYLVDLVGKDLGGVIGRRGETLDAIQQLTGYAVNHGQAKRIRVRVDAEHYRAKREESLERMAHRVADKVVRYRRNVTLEPMNAYERHVVHTALQERADVTTYSIGTEPNRRTVVAYSQGEHRN